jgi:hypothetical protein
MPSPLPQPWYVAVAGVDRSAPASVTLSASACCFTTAAVICRRSGAAIVVHRGAPLAARGDGEFVIDPDNRGDFIRLLAAVSAEALAGVVYLWGLDAPATEGLTTAALEASALLTCRGPLHLVQAWEEAGPAAEGAEGARGGDTRQAASLGGAGSTAMASAPASPGPAAHAPWHARGAGHTTATGTVAQP